MADELAASIDMGRSPEQLAREAGMELAKELFHGVLRAEPGTFVGPMGRPLPPGDILQGAADFLAYKTRKFKEEPPPSSEPDPNRS